jgi:hypothetical protein
MVLCSEDLSGVDIASYGPGTMDNAWKNTSSMNYYYRKNDGRIIGSAWHLVMNSTLWIAKVYADAVPFTNESEKVLGHFIDEKSAMHAVERYWQIEENTLELWLEQDKVKS